jgi:hypothetical protein
VPARINANDDDFLESDLAILNLGDVLELCSEAINSTERRSFGEVEFAGGEFTRFIIFGWHVDSFSHAS